MQLSFASKRIRTLCESEGEANRELGLAAAAELRRHLADLNAAPTIVDLPLHERVLRTASGQRTEHVVVLGEGWEMTFTAGHLDNPIDADGGIAWARVTRVKILRIGRAHG